MKQVRDLVFFCVLVNLASLALIARANPSDTLWTWIGVEVVTNEVEHIENIRVLAQLPVGHRAALSDPALPKACENIRLAYPMSRFDCSVVVSDGGAALYTVEMDKISRVDTRLRETCLHDVNLDSTVVSRLAELTSATVSALHGASTVPHTQFVHPDKYLDTSHPALSELQREIFRSLQNQTKSLEVAVRSCDPGIRSTAMQLLNYSGEPPSSTPSAVSC